MESPNITDPLGFLIIQIQETLRTVLDPELNINIIDMGLVYAIEVLESEKQILIAMTLSSPHCPMGEAILESVKNCLERCYPEYKAVVNLTWEPQWNYENITEEGLRLLGQ